MSCPAGSQTGLIQLMGPIASSDFNRLLVNKPPQRLSIKFGSRSTPASLQGNRVDDISNNTCSYKGKSCTMSDIQIVAPVHTGYNLPGNTDTPRAELIMSFSINSAPSTPSEPSGILLCLPIYESSSSSHDLYIEQMVLHDPTAANHASLESLFYSSDTDTSQSSFGYTTCFETQDAEENVDSNSLFVYVFPNGIHLSSGTFQSLYAMLGQTLTTYQIPPGLRGGDKTVRTYTIDNDGNKVVTPIDKIYTTQLSTCSDEFKNIFEYFSDPPKRSSTGGSQFSTSSKSTAGTCPTVKQYKCMPFDQLRDVQEGGYVQMSDGTCLDKMIVDNKTLKSYSTEAPYGAMPVDSSSGYNVEEIEGMVGGVIGGALVLVAVIWAVSAITKSE